MIRYAKERNDPRVRESVIKQSKPSKVLRLYEINEND
jgi:hypothetical protein